MSTDPTLTADNLIPFVTVTNWIRSAALCGFSIGPMLRDVGVDIDQLHPESAVIRVPAMLALMQRCVDEAHQRDPQLHFPLVLGESFAFDYLSDVETFLTTSPTLRAATPSLQWLPQLINPFMQLSLQEHGTQARLVLTFTHPNAHEGDSWHFSESIFVTFCKFARLMLGQGLWAGEITFQHQARPGSDATARALGLPVRFGQDITALWFDRALLDHPLRGALPSLHETAARRIAEQLALRHQATASQPGTQPRDGLGAQIEARLRRHPALMGQGIDALAEALGLHPRTLQRRLREEGEQLSGIVNRVRHELACQWLHDPTLTVEDISEQLGFADRRSFTQAFSRWTGQSPSDYRRQGNP